MLRHPIKKNFVLICILIIPIFIPRVSLGDASATSNVSSAYNHKIIIKSNSNLDAFVAGNGTTGLTFESAHIIENFTIHTNTQDYGIFMQNINRFLIIRNCFIIASEDAFSEKSGIEIRLSSNIFIENCTVMYHEIGIQFLDSHYSSIDSSNLTYNTEAGVRLIEADYNQIINNTICYNLGYGIHLKRAHENTVVNNTIEENQDLGIYNRGNNNIFIDNSCEPSTHRSIYNKTWLWVIIGVAGAVFFIGGLMFFITWRGR
jgi:parallel beta-helix repeat protein